MTKMHELGDLLCRELEEIAGKGELNTGDLDVAHKLSDTIKNLLKIEILYDEIGREEESGHRVHRGQGYARDEGREHMVSRMEDMMRTASARDREILRRAVKEIREA